MNRALPLNLRRGRAACSARRFATPRTGGTQPDAPPFSAADVRPAGLSKTIGWVLWVAVLSLTASAATDGFFADEVLVRGRNVEIRRPALENAYLQFKANATLRNQPIPPDRREELEAMLLDRLVVTELMLKRATDADREWGRAEADKFVTNVIREAGSETAFNRQLIALGFSREDFESQVRERATCEHVVERELQSKVTVSDEELQSFFDANQEKLKRPEMVRVRHILLATRDPQTGAEVSDATKTEKHLLAETLLKRARAGEAFPALVKEFSDDTASKDKDGEYVFSRGQMAPEFEAAAFSLEPNQISHVVTTVYGYHLIQLIQRIPAEAIPLDQIRDDLRTKLIREKVQETLMPEYLKQLKNEAGLEYLNGARPPREPASLQEDPKL